jgi:hypothetical protein
MNPAITFFQAKGDAPSCAVQKGLSSHRGLLKAMKVFRNLGLKFSDFVQRAFSENSEIARIFWQNVNSVGFQNALHPAHLF